MRNPPPNVRLGVALLAALCGAPRGAAAHAIAEELSSNSAQASAANAHQGSLSSRLLSDWDVNGAWMLHADFTLTHEAPVAAPRARASARRRASSRPWRPGSTS